MWHPDQPWWSDTDDVFGLSDPVYDLIFLPAIILCAGYLTVRAVVGAFSAKPESEA